MSRRRKPDVESFDRAKLSRTAITAEELAEVNRLDAVIAPGPWSARPHRDDPDNREIVYLDKGAPYRLAIVCGWDRHEEHAAFIVLARTLLPRLAAAHCETLAERDALAAKVESMIAAHDERARALDFMRGYLADLLRDHGVKAHGNDGERLRQVSEIVDKRKRENETLVKLVRTMIREADAHRDGVKTDRATTAALASERLWEAAENARKTLARIRK